MKTSLLVAAFCSITFGGLAPLAFAQTPPSAALVAQKSGYDLLLEAGALIKDGPNGEPSTPENLTPTENLRNQRLAVARNAPALAKLREALALGAEVPLVQNYDDFSFNLGAFAKARELTRQLVQESDVRAADGDAMGAAQSGLDALQLGAQISRGPLVNSLVGVAISSLGRLALERNANLLDATQSHDIARKLDDVSAQMPTFAEILRGEEKTNVELMRLSVADLNDPVKREQAQTKLDKGTMDEVDAKLTREMLRLSVADLEADFHRVFDAGVTRAASPYFVAVNAEPLRGATIYANMSAEILSMPITRFNSERNTLSNRLLAAALRLRAIKLESGVYPETFEAGTDPFSPTLAPLIYKRAGDSYVLYSVGPDGKDDNGGEIQTLVINEDTGAKSVNGRLQPESFGDIVAPVL